MRLAVITLAVLGFAVIQTPVRAEDEEQGVCRADIEKFCKDVKPRRAVGRCLSEHESELSPACQERIAARKERGKEFASACKADADKLCKDTQAGEGRLKCLKEHEAELSPGCKSAFAKAHKAKE